MYADPSDGGIVHRAAPSPRSRELSLRPTLAVLPGAALLLCARSERLEAASVASQSRGK
jgi:hypothetical protein